MKYAIIESGGKQYRAVEGGTLDVDRLSVEPGKKLDLENILLMADGEDVKVGTPVVNGILVRAVVLAHVKGPKVVTFKYRPKKRIRVKSGHRHQYTRLMVEFIGSPDEEGKPARMAKPAEVEEAAVETAPKTKVEKSVKAPKATAKPAAKKTTKPASPAKKTTTKKTTK